MLGKACLRMASMPASEFLCFNISIPQVREGVRTLPEVLALAQAIEACPALSLRGIATHHGKLVVFAPIVAALRANVSQAWPPSIPVHASMCMCAL